jgi:hypothetical protein
MSKLRCLIGSLLGWTLFLLAGCGWWQPATPPIFLPAMTPKAGGMVLPTAQPPLTADGTSTVVTQTSAILQPGQLVVAVNPEGLTLQADASVAAPSMERYRTGTAFTVLEPNGDYNSYPVQKEGHTWYRFQASDGLVGWAMIEAIVPANLPASTATPAR